MAITILDNRTTVDNADDETTGWTPSDGTQSFAAEGNLSVATAYNIATGTQFYTASATVDHTAAGNEMIYIWSGMVATQNGWKEATLGDSSHMMLIGDGTNQVALAEAGNDRDVFKHGDGQVGFQCFLIDIDYLPTKDAAGEILAVTGSYAALNEAALEDYGGRYVTLSKALGGGDNCFTDIIRYGTGGITVYGGGAATQTTFLEIATEDRDTASGKGHGVLREYTSGTYGVQGTLQFGRATSLGVSYFLDDTVIVNYEDRDVNDDKFQFIVEGNVTDTNDFRLSSSVIVSARPGVTVDMSSSNIDDLHLTNVSFTNLLNAVSFPTDTNGTTRDHIVTGCIFTACGTVIPGSVAMTGCNFIDSNTDELSGAVTIDANSDLANWSNLTFSKDATDTTQHAIVIEAAGTYTFTSFSYTGYEGTGNEAAVRNESGGAVIINVSGGDTPTVQDASGTTTVNNLVDINIKVVDSSATAIQNAAVWVQKTVPDSYLSHASNNVAGDSTLEITTSTSADTPGSGWLEAQSGGLFYDDNYRYISRTATIFTLPVEVTATADAGGSTTSIVDASASFDTDDILVGDPVHNDAGALSYVDAIAPTTLTVTARSDGGSWASSAYSVNTLIRSYITNDIVEVPFIRYVTDVSGDVTNQTSHSADVAITLRARKSTAGTRYFPSVSSGTLTNTGLTSTVQMTEDTIAS